MMQRPSYGTSKRALWISSALAWTVVFLLIIGGLRGSAEAVALAPTVIPSMLLLIAAMLGIHRFSGSMDFRTAQDRSLIPPSTSPYLSRDQPTDDTGETR
jgi:hypothetical protein